MCALSSAALTAQLSGAAAAAAQSIDPVIQWNRNLLAIVRTPGAQPATIHPTRSFAILHAAIYDAVNAIDQTHQPYAVRITGVSRRASQPAAVDAAAHDVLVALYPAFTATLDAQYQESLTLVPDGAGKTEGIRVGGAVAEAMLALRESRWREPARPCRMSSAPHRETTSRRRQIFQPQPQFTHWPNVDAVRAAAGQPISSRARRRR